MSRILKTHPKSVQVHKDLILACLDDKDESIRLRALDLLYGMVSKKNLMKIVTQLIKPLLGEEFLLATPEVKSNQELLNDVSEENGNSTTTSLRADSPS
jgi:hypothetical protein